MSTPLTIQNFLFDLDGTIINSKEGITSSFQYALQALHQPVPTKDELEWCIGPPLAFSFSKLLSATDSQFIDKAILLYREQYSAKGKYQAELYPSIVNVLQTLRDQEKNIFIVTSKLTAFVRDILSHFSIDTFFGAVYGGELHDKGFNKSHLVRDLITTHSIPKENTIIIGDTKHDILAGKMNHILAGGVCYGFGTQEELQEAGADYLFRTPADILSLLI